MFKGRVKQEAPQVERTVPTAAVLAAVGADEAAAAEPKTFSIKEISGAGSEPDIPTRIVRTISTIDDLVLEQVRHTTPSLTSFPRRAVEERKES